MNGNSQEEMGAGNLVEMLELVVIQENNLLARTLSLSRVPYRGTRNLRMEHAMSKILIEQ